MAKKLRPRGYRTASSYQSRDPAKRAIQLANLKGGSKARKLNAERLKNQRPVDSYSDDIVSFAQEHFYITETRKPIGLLDWQKDMLREIFHSDKTYSMALLGMPKKSGKSTLAAMIALWFLIHREFAEIYILGADFQQGQLVIFEKISKAIRMHSLLSDMCDVKVDSIRYGESRITVLGCSKTSAGLNPDLVLIDEAWQFETIEAKRTIDELTNVPTKDMLILVTTYAGFEDSEDSHLYQWYQAGMNQSDPDITTNFDCSISLIEFHSSDRYSPASEDIPSSVNLC